MTVTREWESDHSGWKDYWGGDACFGERSHTWVRHPYRKYVRSSKNDKYACAIADKIISESREMDEGYEYFDAILDDYKDSMCPLCEKDIAETEAILANLNS